jgi:hypothetical protein
MKKARGIFVLDRGWVLTGFTPSNPPYGNRPYGTITDAAVIRLWGTTAGLGQLAERGPTERTILDPLGSVWVPEHAIIFYLLCSPDGLWEPKPTSAPDSEPDRVFPYGLPNGP